jgi:glycosyltransferase involved in cell wall biosynthesis
MEVSKWRKSIVWRLCQRSAIQYADCIHATAQSEYEEIRAVGLKNPVAIVPNGIDPPDLPDKPPERGVARRRTILALGRIHRKKALEVLILAWAKLESHYPDWRVRIIGPAECGHDNELKRLAQAHELERLTIEGPVYGNEKFAIYSDADLFVLPTRNENFGNVVAEALASAVPVISTKGAPWSALELERCGWWIDHGVDPMAQALVTAMNTDAYQLAQMGQRGRAWMKRDFGWERVAQDMCAVYAWLRQEGSMPPTVRLT